MALALKAGTEQAVDVEVLREENRAYVVYATETPGQPGTYARSSIKKPRLLQAVRSVHLLPVHEKDWRLSPAALQRLMRSKLPRSCATDVSPRPGAVTLKKGTEANYTGNFQLQHMPEGTQVRQEEPGLPTVRGERCRPVPSGMTENS